VGARLQIDEIGRILEMLRENGVTEFRLEREGEKFTVRRGSENPQVVTFAPAAQVAAPIVYQEAIAEAPAAVASGKKLHEVRSPMVGTFYRKPSPDAEAYVSVGSSVKKGSVLCIVEAMKLMNEIESDITGKIAEVCLEDGQMAEYGEVLFRIEVA
jgi:acetyl-CoA carboxylase biotin carboxyl carrier protein